MKTGLQWALRTKEKRKEKARNMPERAPREEIAYAGSQKANVHVEILCALGHTLCRRRQRSLIELSINL